MKQILTLLFILSIAISNAQEVIAFELGDDNRIYLKGLINQSDTLNLVFDLGANITVINKTKMEAKNVNIKFDTIVNNGGGNGTSKESKSFNNLVKIGTKDYTGKDVLGISYPESEKLDGLIGWDFFEDKIVEIDFESKELLISDKLPEYSDRFRKSKLKFISGLPYIKMILYNGKKKVKIWTMLDTGYNSTLKVYYNTVIKNKLANEYQVIGKSTSFGTDGTVAKSDYILIPRIDIGGFEIYNMPGDFAKTKVDSDIPALFGGNLLKRFHIILDFKNKEVYLMPNRKINSEF
ncbi:aspartyl protease family protein [Polaribacter litorisediminis]|uniref:aspartyl protease family protein n=1 Tax=Polaribacter litorisediminis TaxID=1908341 RepID=UPI001CBAA077|nr:aspartyl protease family protein [Polaribacter litorisediminis]UAM97788.1 aspartyl protease family protein [Polaribacter litorisediminis]